ncbi:MAG: hypothetical protein CVV64_03380 [Candidatus Wallbacteria bacterium HGW-Wallbacteria-1]|uniref:Uncharacterized protein n=1 Tax=Candidatus Wallbacteria bacterium HGW-Wallbacteria-1 TaxID=2013854 RepID=A0A2N1PTP6_9BACT|nr:MAG: hypothetical protein CVV64_03380 [Candidatus Wallbacteria bacterium HGW-Wallbacteria-1]
MKKYLFFAFFAALVISFVRFYIKTEREIQEILDELEREEARARDEESSSAVKKEEAVEEKAEASASVEETVVDEKASQDSAPEKKNESRDSKKSK